MNRSILVSVLVATACLAAPRAFAESPEDREWGVSLKQKLSGGNDGYRYSDTTVDATLPYGLDLNVGLNAYRNDSSSTTPTITFGGGWTHGLFTYSGSYAITTLANDYEANTVDAGVSAHSEDKDFKTTVSVDAAVTHHRYFVRFPRVSNETDMTQRAATASLYQRFFKNLEAGLSLTVNTYDRDLLVFTRALNRRSLKPGGKRAGALAGLMDGFPDWSAKYSLGYDFDSVPLTARFSYQSTKMIDTFDAANTTSDTETYDADYDLAPWATLTAEYGHFRQTSNPSTDSYGLQLVLRY